MGLARLAELHGVATTYAPSPATEVHVDDATVVAVLAALGVDASTPAAIASATEAAEREAAARLLPPTVVWWAGEPPPAWSARLPAGTVLSVDLEDGGEARLRADAGTLGLAAAEDGP
ncbi:4-alpha-glucanotransferase, partial [Streptomyces bomunensis]|nr:4-alpha-glucanotransferase [Streptomyces montanisoli]